MQKTEKKENEILPVQFHHGCNILQVTFQELVHHILWRKHVAPNQSH